MANYNQKYKDQVIATINDNSGNIFDSSLTSDAYFSAVGQKTNSALTSIHNASKVGLWVTKPDSVLNLTNAGSVGLHDDDGNSYRVNFSVALNKHWTNVISDIDILDFDKTAKNLQVYFTGDSTNLTTPIITLRSVVNVTDFTVNSTLPSDVKCNYTTGVHQYITGQTVNLLFDGNLKKGDTITVKRNNRPEHIDTLNFDTDLAFVNLGVDGCSKLELIYKHNSPDTVPTPTPTPVKQYELIPKLQNASIIDPKQVAGNYYLDSSHTTVTIKANTGCTFESDGSLTYYQSPLDRETITIKANHTDTATVSLPSNIDWSIQQEFFLTIGAVNSQIVTSTGGFTNIYKADYDNLLKISNEVILKMINDDIGTYDIKPFFDNLIMLPFNVPSGENSAIVAGKETFKTQLPTVDNNYLTVDLGKITVPEQYKNGYDYYQVKTRLMLPYTSMVDIDPIHVINKTVAIKYVIDVITGDTTINLYNDDDLFYSNQVNLANKVPFISNATSGSQAVVINQLKTMFRNDIKQAYIIIEQPTPILNSDYYQTNEKGTLKAYTGNVKASLLNNVNINPDDLNALQNILESGVKIK